jgi:hypothetical protein
MKLKAGAFVVDTDESRRIATVGERHLFRREDGVCFITDYETTKIVTEKQAFRFFFRAHGDVHNFKWLFGEVFKREWAKSLIEKKRRAKGKGTGK